MTTTSENNFSALRHIKGHLNVADEPHCCFDNQPYGQCTSLVPNQVRSVLRLLCRGFALDAKQKIATVRTLLA